MNLVHAYDEVCALLDRLNFDALFPGFHRFPFAFYDAEHAYVNGSLRPRDERFRGNTAIEDQGAPLAIWNLSDDPADPVELAYGMVHEMFHCFQTEQGESRYPDDLALLQFPDDLDHFACKHRESVCLADAFEHRDAQALRRYRAIRQFRLSQYPQAVGQECRVETVEGLAEAVALRALRVLDACRFRRVTAGYARRLREESALLFDVRRMAYYTGALLALTLAALEPPLRAAWNAQTLYAQNALPVAPDSTATATPGLAQAYRAWQQQKQSALAAHIASAGFTACEARIVGYDPMNMLRVDDLLLCTHFVLLQAANQRLTLQGPTVLRLRPGSARDVVGYYRPDVP